MSVRAMIYTCWAITLLGAVAAAVGTWGGPSWLVFVGVPVLIVFAVITTLLVQRQRRERWQGRPGAVRPRQG